MPDSNCCQASYLHLDQQNTRNITNITNNLFKQMKKSLLKNLFVSALLVFGASNVMADVIETVGATDCSSNFGTREVANQVINGDGGLHYTFINHNGGATTNWYNFIFEANDGNGKYIDMRSDNYGWGDLTDGVIFSNTYNWDAFTSELDGATVDMYIYKKGTHVLVESTITTTANAVRKYQAFYPNVSASTLNCYLMVEKAYLEITKREATDLPTNIDVADEIVGYLDCTSPYVGISSAERQLSNDGKGYEIKFKNINNGATDNYKNWILRCFNNDDPWTMNFYLRADNAALFTNGASWNNTDNINFTMNSNFEWTDFPGEMNGATVDMKVWRKDNIVTVDAAITTSTGKNWTYQYTQSNITSDNCTIAMSQEAALVDISSWTEYDPTATAINAISDNAETSDAIYNIAGQRIGNNYKGVVVKNGKKFIQK